MDNTQNFVVGLVTTAPSPATTGTSITVSNGSLFPDPSTFGAYNLCLWSQAGDPTPSNCEIVRVTAKSTSGDNAVLTVTRAQESTSGLSVAVGWKAYYSLTQKYFDDLKTELAGKQATLTAGTNIDITSNTIKAKNFYFGTCSNSSNVAARTVTCSGFALETGATIAVKFTNESTTALTSLDVNSTGAVNVYLRYKNSSDKQLVPAYYWADGQVVTFTYDGTNFIVVNPPAAQAGSSTFGLTRLNDTTSSTSTSMAATANALKTTYDVATSTNVSAITTSSATETISISPTSARRFDVTQSTSAVTYTLTPSQAGLVWTIKITKTLGDTVAFDSNVTLDDTIDDAWTTCAIVFIAWATNSIKGYIIEGE